MLRLEITHVLAQLLGEVALRLALLDVGAIDARDVLVLEDRRHRLDRRQEILDRIQVAVLEHTGLLRGRIRVVRDGIPGAEHDVVQLGERNEVLDERRTLLGALAQADGRQLRE
jgi:hypothetical protein